MIRGRCDHQECTVAETGRCLLHGDPSQCPNFKSEDVIQAEGSAVVARSLEPGSVGVRRFYSGLELGTDDVIPTTEARYAHLIPILGLSGAGKTCLLSSLYLMLSQGWLKPDFWFSGSLTLQGFEDRVRRVRNWPEGRLPEKLADHTALPDPRRPAILHLAVRAASISGRRIDLLFTDLPGEWTKSLIDRVDTAARFDFLHRADRIIIVIDAVELAEIATRHVQKRRMKLLLERLRDFLGPAGISIPVALLFSKCDRLNLRAPDGVEEISRYAADLGFCADVVIAAAFSCRPETVDSGTGILKTLQLIADGDVAGFPPSRLPLLNSGRSFQRFRI